MENQTKIPLTIFKQKSYLDGITLFEKISPNLVTALIKNKHLLNQDFDLTNYSQRIAAQHYKNEVQQLIGLSKLYNAKCQGYEVRYWKAKHGFGRSFPQKSLGCTSLPKKTRNTLIKDNYEDFDMKNAQISILLNLCKTNDIPCPALQSYVENVDSYREKVASTYGVSKGVAKKLFLRMAFLGTFENWCIEENVEEEKRTATTEIQEMEKELKDIATVFKSHNPQMYETCRKLKEAKGDRNFLGSFFSHYLQEYETRIMEVVVKWFARTFNSLFLIYEFDGIKILKSDISIFGGSEKMIEELQKVVLNATGFEVVFELKPIEEYHDIEFEKEWEVDSTKEIVPAKYKFFEDIAEEFEKDHAKVVEKSVYVKIRADGDVIFFTQNKLIESYSHMVHSISLYDPQSKQLMGYTEESFISRWISFKNPSIRRYRTFDVFPNTQECPEDVLNMWSPFAMSLVEEYDERPEELKFILKHIYSICGKEKAAYKFFCKWIAQMLQQPHKKNGVMPIFSSAQGTGKGQFMTLVKKMIGKSKFFEPTDPKRDVWGNFNGMMQSAFLVNLNEISKQDISDFEKVLKGLITDDVININQKGIPQYSVSSFHRFILTTNYDKPVNTTADDRRNFVMRCSEDCKGNSEYFKKLAEYIADENVVKTVFEHFMTMNIDDFDPTKIPLTEYHADLKDSQESAPVRFLRYIANDKYWVLDKIECRYSDEGDEFVPDPEIITLDLEQIYKLFEKYVQKFHLKYETNAFDLALKIRNITPRIPDKAFQKKKTKFKNVSIINFVELQLYFEGLR